jgi:cell division protein FtsQ
MRAIAWRRSTPRRRGRLRGLRVVVLVAAAIVAVAAGLAWSPWFSVRHVELIGVHHEPRTLLERAAGVSGHPPLVFVEPGRAAARLERLPWVLDAEVQRRWPDTVVVHVTERMPVALAEGGDRAYLVDPTGRVLGVAPPGVRLPVIEGAGRPPVPGRWLASSAARALARVAGALGRLRPEATTIRWVQGSVVLGLVSGGEALLGAPSSLAAKLTVLASVLATAPPGPGSAIDVRVPEAPLEGPLTSLGPA